MSLAAPPARASMRFEVLDALRGICAVLVVLYHFRSNGYISALPVVRNGWMFVDYFFVLSGFVITHSYAARLAAGQMSLARFVGLRLGRIYPLHLFVLLAFLTLEVLLIFGGDAIGRFVSRAPFSGTRGIEPLIQHIALTHSFGIGAARGWNLPSWSIAAEVWTYLLFALVFVVAKSRAPVVSVGLAVAGALALIATKPDLLVTFEGGFVRCIFGFGVGVATYHAFQRFHGPRGNLQELVALLATGAFVTLSSGYLTFLGPLVFAIMIYVLASQKGVVSRALRLRPFQFLGLTSYSIYMIHAFVQGRLGEVLQITRMVAIEVDPEGRTLLRAAPIVSDVVTLVMLGLVIAGAYVTYRFVETPGQSLARRMLAMPEPVARAKAGQP